MLQSSESLKAVYEEVVGNIDARFSSAWPDVSEELGLGSLPSPQLAAGSLRFADNQIEFTVPIHRPASWQFDERDIPHIYQIPVSTVDKSGKEIRAQLKDLFPIECDLCHARHPLGTGRCDTQCLGTLVWRNSAPRPRYYVDEYRNYGKYGISPGNRTLRFAVDLDKQALIALSLSPKHAPMIIEPVRVTGDAEDAVSYLQRVVLKDLSSALRGTVTAVRVEGLGFQLPSWCMKCATYVFLDEMSAPRLSETA